MTYKAGAEAFIQESAQQGALGLGHSLRLVFFLGGLAVKNGLQLRGDLTRSCNDIEKALHEVDWLPAPRDRGSASCEGVGVQLQIRLVTCLQILIAEFGAVMKAGAQVRAEVDRVLSALVGRRLPDVAEVGAIGGNVCIEAVAHICANDAICGTGREQHEGLYQLLVVCFL